MNVRPPARRHFGDDQNVKWQKSKKSLRKSEKKEAKKGENRKNSINRAKTGERPIKPCVDAVNKPIETAVITPCSNFLRRMRRKDIRQVG